MTDEYRNKLLMACLAVLVRRANGTVVIEEPQIQAAFESGVEVTWKHDRRAGCVRLTVPCEETSE